jgi:hypothetical protein
MRKTPQPPVEQLRDMLEYDPANGTLRWRVVPLKYFQSTGYSAERKCAAWNGKYAGKVALAHRDKPGSYAYGDVFGTKVYAHRAILAMEHGVWPEADVDHINGDRTDNRLINLRPVSRQVNAMNRSIYSRNRSGVMGVYWDRSRSQWAAEIFVNGVKQHIGRFERLEDAKRARAEREVLLGYHPNHGRQPLTIDR